MENSDSSNSFEVLTKATQVGYTAIAGKIVNPLNLN